METPAQSAGRPHPPERVPLRLSDGYETYMIVHSPPGGPGRLPVIYLHGIQSHPGWFTGSAAELARRGHTVFQVTRRGSGTNERARGHAPSAAQLLGDVRACVREATEHCGTDRVHLLGVSWGGKLAAAYVAEAGDQARMASLVLIAPGIVPRVGVAAAVKWKIALSLLLRPRRMFDIPLSDVGLFTDNLQRQAWLAGDDLRLHQATARFLYASRRLDRLLRRAGRGAISVATTLLLAARDRIIDNDRTGALVDKLTAGGAAVAELDAAHTMEFEPDPHPFYNALASACRGAEAGSGQG